MKNIRKTIKESILKNLMNNTWLEAKDKIEKEGFTAEEIPENSLVAQILKPDVITVWVNKERKVVAYQAGDVSQVI